jgi:two-component system NtrC family sensor kinase
MDSSYPAIRAVIIGAGKDGSALLELFSPGSGVDVIGIADTNPEALGLRLAQRLGIPATTDPLSLLAEDRADLIIDVTGDPAMGRLIIENKPPRAQVLGGPLALLVWDVIAHYKRSLRDQLFQAEKLATIGTLASGIAHEINNPLYIITGFAERLRGETRREVIEESVEGIIQAAQRIARIIRDVKTFALKPILEGVRDLDLNQILDEAVKVVRNTVAHDELTVVKRFGALPPVRGKPEDFHQAFLNLLTNAIEAIEGPGTLTLSTTSTDGYVHATIQDSGRGIPPTIIGKVFDPFFTTKTPGKGTGLGLHVVRDIISLYKGYVTVESAPGQGAAFTVTVPAASPAGEEKPGRTERGHPNPAS